MPEGSVEELRVVARENGAVRKWVRLEEIAMKGRRLRGRLHPSEEFPATDLKLRLLSAERWQGTAVPTVPGLRLFTEIRFTGKEAGVFLEIRSEEVPLRVRLSPPERGQPLTGTVEATSWPVPVTLLPPRLSVVEKPTLTARGSFTGFRYELNAEMRGAGLRGASMGEVPLVAELQLQGNAEELILERARLEWDWLEARLSNSLSYGFRNGIVDQQARFDLRADLDRQGIIEAGGLITGTAEVTPRAGESAGITFQLRGESVRYRDYPPANLHVRGNYRHPRLEVNKLELTAKGNGEAARAFSLAGSGEWGVVGHTFQLEAEARADADLLPLPEKRLQLGREVRFRVAAEGTPKDWKHEGRLRAGPVKAALLRPFQGEFRWAGTGVEKVEGALLLQNGNGASLEAEGRLLRADASSWEFTVERFLLVDSESSSLRLLEPVTVGGEWPFRSFPAVEGLVLEDGPTRLALTLRPEAGRLRLRAEQLSSARFAPFFEEIPWPPLFLERLRSDLVETEEGLRGETELDIREVGPEVPLRLRVSAEMEEDVIRIGQMEGRGGGKDVVTGKLQIPARIVRRGKATVPFFRPEPTSELLSGDLSLFLPAELAERYAFLPWLKAVRGLRGNLALSGTGKNPEGTFRIRLAESRGFGEAGKWLDKIPLRDFSAQGAFSLDEIRLASATGTWGGNELRLEGSVPLSLAEIFGKEGGPRLREAFARAEGRLQAPRIDLASLAIVLPPLLRPEGTVSAALSFRSDYRIQGSIRASDWGLRSTLFTRPVENLSFLLAFDGNRLRVREAEARMGLGELGLDGWLRWERNRDWSYRLALRGKQAPLVRTPNLLLRSDLNLVLKGSRKGPTELGGSLQFQDSVFFFDYDPLASKTRSGPATSPPYFSITAPPFADWNLDVELSGEEFLQLRSPYLETRLSVQGNLRGNLRDPLLLARLTAREGTVYFPGVRLSLQKGEVFTTREEPGTLRLNLQASGRKASYVVSMRADGPARNPRIVFDSTPPLRNARILRLLATGSLEGSGLGSLGLYLGKGALGPTAGGNGFWERFSFEVGRDVAESGQNTVDLYFDLGRDLYLHGQYDKYDEQNLDMVWEVYRK